MRSVIQLTLTAMTFLATACLSYAAETDSLAAWRLGVKVRPVAALRDRHVIHAYFNTSPESPDGKFVLYYTSSTVEGETGDLRILERKTGTETVVATGIIAEDAHRAACQQWSNHGRTIVYHDFHEGRWQVMAVNRESHETKVLAQDRQVAFGSPASEWVPIYGCHWNPGPHRDLELVNVVTGQIKTVVKVQDVVDQYGEWIQKRFGHDGDFPLLSRHEPR